MPLYKTWFPWTAWAGAAVPPPLSPPSVQENPLGGENPLCGTPVSLCAWAGRQAEGEDLPSLAQTCSLDQTKLMVTGGQARRACYLKHCSPRGMRRKKIYY